jgi:uncharacterized BrkB/YihY/UPF0761 family membrane protein
MKDLTVSTLTDNLIKWLAWIEGTAIALAVFIVASVGSFVDWRKEIQFIKSRKETNSKNIVSISFFVPKAFSDFFRCEYSETAKLKRSITTICTLVTSLWLSTVWLSLLTDSASKRFN